MTVSTPTLLRRSALEASACLYRYEQLYERGVPDTSDPARRGIGFHAAAFGPIGYVPRLAQTRTRSDHELASVALREAMVAEAIPGHLLGEIEDLFWRWAERFELDLDAFLLAEERQTHAGFTWQPDLVYATIIGGQSILKVVDAKTYYVGFTPEQAKKEFQTAMYLWQARQIWPGFDVYQMEYDFARLSHQVTVTFTAEDFDRAERHVYSLAGTIATAREANRWPATPGPHCQYCRLLCPILDAPENQTMTVYRVQTAAEAKTLAGVILARTQRLAQENEVLKGWAVENGPVEVNGSEFAFREHVKSIFPAKAVIDILESADIPPVFDVSASALKSYLTTKKHARVREALQLLARVKKGWRFGAKKIGTFGEDFDNPDHD